MRETPEHFINFAVLVLTYVISRDLAYLLGPYVAIGIAASAGAALALGSSPAMRWRQVVFYVGLRIAIAMALTVSIAELVHEAGGGSRFAVLGLMPLIAFCIGVVKDYRALVAFFVTLAKLRKVR